MRDSRRVGQASRLPSKATRLVGSIDVGGHHLKVIGRDIRICPLGLASERDRRDACPTLD